MRYDATDEEYDLAQNIGIRASTLAAANSAALPPRPHSFAVRILMTHLNGCPLDLQRLFNADDFNFAHDVFGIWNHFNTETGKLENFFLPRCSKPQPKTTK